MEFKICVGGTIYPTQRYEIETRKSRLRANHICHVGCMEEVCFLKQVLFGELKLGKKKQSKPKQRWNDNVQKDMKKVIIDDKSWCQETEYWYCLTMDKA